MGSFLIRDLGTSDAVRWRTLLGEAFPAGGVAHYLEDFPIWDLALPVARRTVRGAWDAKGELLGGAAARLVSLSTGAGSPALLGAVIGGVATAVGARKQGVASQCMESLLQWCDAQGAEFVALWGSEHAFYSKFGFTLQGEQVRAPLRDFAGALALRPQYRVHKGGWTPQLFAELKRARTQRGLEWDASDLLWAASHPHVQWWTLWQGIDLLAYAGVGKGMDLHHLVHEWGAHPSAPADALPWIFSALAQEDPEAQILAHPEDLPAAPIREGLALLRLRTDAARAQLSRFWFWGLDSA